MELNVWVLIAMAVVALAAFKAWYVPKWLKKQQEKKAARERLVEDED